MIVVIATLVVRPGADAALRAAFAPARAETLKEPGCLAYELHQSLSAPETYVFVEKWETREALSLHARTPHLGAWREATADFTLSRVIEIVHPEKIEVF